MVPYPIDTVHGPKSVKSKTYIGLVLVLNTTDGGQYVYDDPSKTHIPYDAAAAYQAT